MIYSYEVFSKAENEIKRRRTQALSELEKRKNEIETVAPEIAQINYKIINTSVELSKAIMRHDGNLKSTIEKLRKSNLEAQKLIKTLLEDFGYPIDYLDLHFTCSKCQDTGFVNGIRCECFNQLLKKYSIEELNKNCNIALTDFDDFKLDYYSDKIDKNSNMIPRQCMASNLNACKEYVKNFSLKSSNLFFNGNTGLGKTFLSAAIAKKLLQNGYQVAFDSIQNFLRAIENEHFGRVTDKDTLQILNDAELVILDDLGSEFDSPFYKSSLYNIINTRLNKGVPTIISSNLSLDELQSRYDQRIISRLKGMFSWRIFIGEDIRSLNSVMKKHK